MFDHDQRVAFAQAAVEGIEGVSVLGFDTLLVDLATELKVNTIIRGLRAVSDFNFELQMGYANFSINKKIETLYLMPNITKCFCFFYTVREIIRFNGKFEHLVPEKVVKCMQL